MTNNAIDDGFVPVGSHRARPSNEILDLTFYIKQTISGLRKDAQQSSDHP
jgi:hypothetical protein